MRVFSKGMSVWCCCGRIAVRFHFYRVRSDVILVMASFVLAKANPEPGDTWCFFGSTPPSFPTQHEKNYPNDASREGEAFKKNSFKGKFSCVRAKGSLLVLFCTGMWTPRKTPPYGRGLEYFSTTMFGGRSTIHSKFHVGIFIVSVSYAIET